MLLGDRSYRLRKDARKAVVYREGERQGFHHEPELRHV